MAPRHEKLSRREREIIDALFALGDRASTEEIRERLTDPPSYSAVRAMLVRLEAKGHVRHREEGPRYIYTPTKSRARAQKNARARVLRRLAARDSDRAAEAGAVVGRGARGAAIGDRTRPQ